jgi:hypothetical protein
LKIDSPADGILAGADLQSVPFAPFNAPIANRNGRMEFIFFSFFVTMLFISLFVTYINHIVVSYNFYLLAGADLQSVPLAPFNTPIANRRERKKCNQ